MSIFLDFSGMFWQLRYSIFWHYETKSAFPNYPNLHVRPDHLFKDFPLPKKQEKVNPK